MGGLYISAEIARALHITGMTVLLNNIFHADAEQTRVLEATLPVLLATVVVFTFKNIHVQTNKRTFGRAVIAIGCILLSMLSFSSVTTFLYFNF